MRRSFRHRLCLVCLSAALAVPLVLSPRAPRAHAEGTPDTSVREIEIIVDKGAYNPARVEVREGERVRLKFVRKEFNGCTREVVFPKLDIKRELPPNKPVLIELPALAVGEYEFRCGMNMVKGTLVVKPKT